MKQFSINIAPQLQNVKITVKNGAAFSRELIAGNYKRFEITIAEEDIKRVKKYAVKFGDDKNSNGGRWYAHCNAFAMDLIVNYKGDATINTYRPFGRTRTYAK